jgi:hypothetical protein
LRVSSRRRRWPMLIVVMEFWALMLCDKNTTT